MDNHRQKFLKLQRLGLRHFDEIIHDQPKKWLVQNFNIRATKFPVNVTRLVRNIIWQTRERIRKKEREPFTELIRTFWYTHIKPTLARADALSKVSDQYAELVDQLVFLVRDQKLMTYKDMGFRDEGKGNRRIGINSNVILFAEKLGFGNFLDEISDIHSISAFALGGQPSVLSLEFFVREMKNKGVDVRRSFFLFSVVDYDPSGWIIRDSFIKNLKAFGIKNIKNYDLVNPDLLSEEEIKLSRFPVPAGKAGKSKNQTWLKEVRTKKFKNQKFLTPRGRRKVIYGLESEAISTKRMKAKLEQRMIPLLGKSERLLRIDRMEKLGRAIDRLILQKIRGG